MKYQIETEDRQRLTRNFQYQPPKDDQPERYVDLRGTAGAFAEKILGSCPPSRERSLAITKLEEALFWANASIARNE